VRPAGYHKNRYFDITVARILYRPDGRPRLALPGVLALLLSIGLGSAIVAWTRRAPTEDERAGALSSTGRCGAAEEAYVRLLRERPTVPRVLAFVQNHERGARELDKLGATGAGAATVADRREELMTDDGVEEVLEALLPDESLIGRFAWEGGAAEPNVRDAIEAGARRTPPTPWFNHVLAADALRAGNDDAAAAYYEREGLAFPERREDIDEALDLWMNGDDWDAVRKRMQDARVVAAADADTKARIAEHERDWVNAARWTAVGYRDRLRTWSLAMSGVAALAWAFFCARLGKIGERPRVRALLYPAAFGLGVLSVAPTVLLISFEEAKLRLVETGDAARDALYFVFGVGLREEGCKLLLFAPLLVVLRRWGDRLDVLVCGAMVGLGFAAEENLGYLASGDLHVGLGRFLTANFFHMALTGTLAAALDDLVRDPEGSASDFSRTAFTVVGLHGAYDFLLSHDEYGGGYVAMAVLFFVARVFLDAIARARRTVDRGLSLVHVFVLAAAVVTGVSAVHAGATVGPLQAAAVMAEGIVGEIVIFAVLLRALQGM
jgi:RsiW-degrading membrane proteinase PrsW (M82 family)